MAAVTALLVSATPQTAAAFHPTIFKAAVVISYLIDKCLLQRPNQEMRRFGSYCVLQS